ncbi:hypothetical protein [Parvibaculum sp.]|uniref:hypothetical protein n=1 Tax=Parvibaculum sp. TaxID=2024848 RepID=UPI0032651399
MSISGIWRRLTTRRRRKRSFYDTQEVMRRAVEAAGPVDLRLFSDEDLRCVVETDRNEQRRKSAEKELASRMGRRSPHSGETAAGLH